MMGPSGSALARKGVDIQYYENNLNFAIGASQTVIDEKREGWLEILELGSNNQGLGIQLKVYDSAGVPHIINTPAEDGSVIMAVNASNLNLSTSSFWDLVVYNNTSNLYKIGTKYRLYCPKGFQLTINNGSGAIANGAVCAYFSVLAGE